MFWQADINPEAGPYKVLLKRGDFIDYSRNNRDIPYKVYYPDDPPGLAQSGKLPLIIWSHGFGGNRDGAAFLSRYIASHGYVMLHITHHGTDSSLWEGKPGHPWDILRNINIPREASLQRFLDVPFVLDQFREWARQDTELGPYIDFENVGMSGHSYGALTTQIIAGQLFPDENDKLKSYGDERFRAGIAYSPVPIDHLIEGVSETEIYGPISQPLFHMTGTKDESPLKGFDYERRLIVANYAQHPEQYILVKEGGDHMVYNGTRGKLEKNDNREQHEAIIKVTSLAYWDAKLKDDDAARAWLKAREDQGIFRFLGPGHFYSY